MAAEAFPTIDRRRLTLLLVPIFAFSAMSYLATVIWARLLETGPLWLLALDSRNRHLLLVAALPHIEAHWFVLVALLRLTLSDPLYYLLGREFGGVGIQWYEQQTGRPSRWLRWMERNFARWSYPFVALIPNNLICLLAGASRLNPWAFGVCNIGGTLVRLVLVVALGDALSEPLEPVFDFVERYQWWIVAASFLAVFVQVGFQARRTPAPPPLPEAAPEEEDERQA